MAVKNIEFLTATYSADIICEILFHYLYAADKGQFLCLALNGIDDTDDDKRKACDRGKRENDGNDNPKNRDTGEYRPCESRAHCYAGINYKENKSLVGVEACKF